MDANTCRVTKMPSDPMTRIVQQLHFTALVVGGGRPDEALLNDFVRHHDADALAELVRRHGPMVWGVCRRVLHRRQDAEDAFQATFLVFVQKAATVANPAAVGNWLYGVAHNTAVRVRATNAKKARREQQVPAMPDPPNPAGETEGDLRHTLDAEMALLPDRYRAVIVLCDLEGRTRTEVARTLGVPEGTVASRLTRARAILGKRLVRRGMATGALVGLIPNAGRADVPPALVTSTIEMATLVSTGGAELVPATVSALTQKVLFAMTMKKITIVALVLFAAVATGLGGLAVAQPQVEKQAAEQAAKRAEAVARQAVVAKEKDAAKEAATEAAVEVRLLDNDAKPLTDWIALTADETELYSTMMGGRVVKGKLTDRDGKGGMSFEINGSAIAFRSKEFKVAASTPGPITILLTEYQGGVNLSLMYKYKPGQADEDKPGDVVKVLKTKDFWDKAGRKDGRKWTEAEKEQLEELKSTSKDTVIRLRANKVWADLSGKSNTDGDDDDAIAGCFKYLEMELGSGPVKQLCTEMGFNYYRFNKGVGANGWFLIEHVDGKPKGFSGGVNLEWNGEKKRVTKQEVWGQIVPSKEGS